MKDNYATMLSSTIICQCMVRSVKAQDCRDLFSQAEKIAKRHQRSRESSPPPLASLAASVNIEALGLVVLTSLLM